MDQTGKRNSLSPIKISMNNLDKLIHQIKDQWKLQNEENEKLFDQFLTYCKIQQQVFTVKFICSLSGESLEEPVSLQQCVIDKKHLQDCFDLKSILKYLIQNESNFMQDGYIQCPLCRSKSHFKTDIPFVPNLFFISLKEKLNHKQKPIIYQVASQTIIPIYPGILGKEQICYQNSITSIITTSNDPHQNFSTVRKLTKPNEAFKLSYLCLMGNIRIQVPVRGAQCKHVECYDFLYLQSNMSLSKNKIFKCLYLGCQETVNINELCFDQELYDVGLQSYNFSSDFMFEQQSQHLIDTYQITNYDPNIVAYRKLVPTTSETIAYIKNIFDITDRIYSSQKNQEFTDKFYEHPLKGELNILKNEFTNCKVEIPCRCIRCNRLDVCDLRLMSCILYQVQHPDNRSGVKNYQLACPLCKNAFTPKKYHRDQTVYEQVYVDTKMLQFLSLNKNFNQLTKEKYLQFLDGKLNPFLRFEELESPIINYQSCNLKIRCLLSNQRIKVPVRGIYCQHPEAFDEQSVLELLQLGQIDLHTMQCPKCQQSIFKLTHDHFLKELLSNYKDDSDDVEIITKSKVIKPVK